MKLIPVNNKLGNSIWNSIHSNVSKTSNSISLEVRQKISDEVCIPIRESIQDMQIRILNNLQNSSK